jgi:hypothetical protein
MFVWIWRIPQSSTYTLVVTLSTADATRSWSLGVVDISTGTPNTITSAGTYATSVPYVLNLLVPAASSSGAVANTINFTATAN